MFYYIDCMYTSTHMHNDFAKILHNKQTYDSPTSKGILIKAHISMAAKHSQQMKHKTNVSSQCR